MFNPAHVREWLLNLFHGSTGHFALSISVLHARGDDSFWVTQPELLVFVSHTYGDDTTPKHSLVTQITQNRVAHHKKHVVHFMYKTRGLEKVTDVKLIENQIV